MTLRLCGGRRLRPRRRCRLPVGCEQAITRPQLGRLTLADLSPFLDILSGKFDGVVGSVVRARAIGAPDPMRAASEIVLRHLDRAWKLVWTKDVDVFRVAGAQRELRLNPAAIERILASVIGQFAQADRALEDVRQSFADPEALTAAIVECFLALFLTHELFHIDQRLGSDQYRDSDDYLRAVGILDYQADVVSLWMVGEVMHLPDNLQIRDRLLFLLAIHIFAMVAFADAVGQNNLDRSSFDRLLVWLFHAARVARSEEQPTMLHPSIQVAPTVSLPKLESRLGDHITIESFDGLSNREADITQDLVVTLADGRGIQRVYRLSSTDPDRGVSLARAVFEGNFGAAREHFEELFHQYGESLDFGVADQLVHEVEAAAMAAERLLEPPGRSLGLDDVDVMGFFERVETLLLFRSELDATGISEYRERWQQGYRHDIEARLSKIVDRPADVTAELRHMIRRVALYLRLALEERRGKASQTNKPGR